MNMMLLPPSNHILPPANDENRNKIPNPKEFLVRKESLIQHEKQISVDPISVKESSAPKFNDTSLLPLPLPPSKTKFLSMSLPSSATSSPMSKQKKKKLKNRCHPSPSPIDPLSRQHSLALTRLNQLRENHLRRSKSCGEGRTTAPSDEFDMWFKVNNGVGVSFRRNEGKTGGDHGQNKVSVEGVDHGYEEKFKCGALCLFLPGFGRGRPVRPRKEGIGKEVEKEMGHVISRTVSLEKFECGSWTSSAIVMDNVGVGHDEDSGSLFFDLPLELIRSRDNDSDSPVTTAFMFGDKERKGVLKTSNTTNTARKSQESSSRHVRFSTSSPRSNPTSPTSCITPRLRKARDDFNAFLEAQSA
ncbi:hypothetical protein Acr_18g0002170 [Actinidia rufa]|uniref:Uncharacterized protein n=1 Tax=Actinidia rufa TaxID=165716 RepID=A0A7J0G5K1_9ERIC|nr:hypothetical protein Acr_18g0002170 [Actinidia rufa]